MTTRDHILQAAARIYAEHGFRGATTRRIADAAGVNEVTLFRQFGSKAVLLERAVRHQAEQLLADSLPAEPVAPLSELTLWCKGQLKQTREASTLLTRFLSEMGQHPEMLRCVQEAPALTCTGGLAEYLERLRERGWIEECDLRAAIQLLRGAILGDALFRTLNPELFPQESKAPALYAGMFLKAIGLRVKPVPLRRPSRSDRAATAATKTARTAARRSKKLSTKDSRR